MSDTNERSVASAGSVAGKTREWVLDATLYSGDGMCCFCPIEPDGTVVTGVNVLSRKSPGPLVAVIHADGQEAAERWVAANEYLLEWLER
jgi:hypothetical protein